MMLYLCIALHRFSLLESEEYDAFFALHRFMVQILSFHILKRSGEDFFVRKY